MNTPSPLILASTSTIRRKLLEGVGLSFSCQPAPIDERALENELGNTAPQALALHLAQAKAKAVSANNPEALVIGADQVLEHQGVLLHKAQDLGEAAAKLRHLQGSAHTLIASVALVRAGETLWSGHDTANLRMRPLNRTDISNYIERAGDAVTASVGAYRLEEVGAALFERIDGDYFTILGLPLLPLLAALRDHGIDPINSNPLTMDAQS